MQKYDLGKELEMSAAKCDLKQVRVLLKQGAPVNFRDDGTPLYYAANSECIDVVTELLRAGANPNLGCLTSTVGETPLLCSMETGNLQIIQTLINGGADVNQPDIRGQTPLIAACLRSRFGAAQILLSSGANPQIKDQYGNTPLSICLIGPAPNSGWPGWPGKEYWSDRIAIILAIVWGFWII
ncbi:MAG: ankyrin repeat domain-containing protein [Chthonomonadales bacterium]